MKVIHNICEKNNINYFIEAGTLLGAVRHKGFIPWDDDADVAMFREDYEKFLEIAPEELPHDLFLQTEKTDAAYNHLTSPCKIRCNDTITLSVAYSKNVHNGIWVDVFPIDNLPVNTEVLENQKMIAYELWMNSHKISFEEKQKIFKKMQEMNLENSLYSSYGVECVSRGDYIFNNNSLKDKVKYEFEGELFYGPRDYDEYLTNMFGNYMKLPPIEKQKPHNWKSRKKVQ